MNGADCGTCGEIQCKCKEIQAEKDKQEKIKNGQTIVESLWQAMSKLSKWRMKLIKWLWPDIIKVADDMLNYYWQNCDKEGKR